MDEDTDPEPEQVLNIWGHPIEDSHYGTGDSPNGTPR